MPTYPTLQVAVTDRLATVILDNGRVNAINTQLSRDLGAAFLDLGDNDTIDGGSTGR